MADLKARGFNTSAESLKQYLEVLKKEDEPIKARHEKFHKLTLKEYQMSRLTTFVDPESDLLGSGYHVWQSRIAIGSGGLTGKGLLGGTQSHYTFLPIRHTDFIFSVVGEEYGFLGSTLVLVMYFIVLYRGVRIISLAKDVYGTLLAAGIVSMFAFHVILNVAMTAGVAPVTGIPLPLFSYGGSNMLMNMAALGVLMNVYIRRQKLIF
jgi:rod shape determining protein RodA